jgi:ABC-2 type transport system ATP-binding protein
MQLQIENLSKTYSNGVQALKDVNLTIYQGMFGLLGPNGAGKSTLMRTLATLQEADSGKVTLGEIDVLNQKQEVRKILGYLPQEFGVYPKVDAEDLLTHLAVLKGITDRNERKQLVNSLLQKTNLWDSRNKSLGSYSGGMKQRFGIAQALLANPKLIIVDEPTAGLDPAERNRFLNLLSELGENTIVILSTHIVDDVEELCSHMAIIHNGSVLYKGRPDEAVARLKGKIWMKRVAKEDLDSYRRSYLVVSEHLLAGTPELHILSDTDLGGSFENIPVTLEDVYFAHIAMASKRETVSA